MKKNRTGGVFSLDFGPLICAAMERQRNSGQVKRIVGHYEFLNNSAISAAISSTV